MMKSSIAVLLTLFGLILLVPAPARAQAQAQPVWGEPIDNITRFVVLETYNNEAVYDKETGLVWEQSPLHPGSPGESGPTAGRRNWVGAHMHCNNRIVGNRRGWRLPTLQELASLIDPTTSNPALPVGHPFVNVVRGAFYWSATSSAGFAMSAWDVFIAGGSADPQAKGAFNSVWCVRGGQGADPQ